MKKILVLSILTSLFSAITFAQEPVILSDCTITYNVTIQNGKADAAVNQAMLHTNKVVYIKGARSRSDLETRNFKQTMIYDSKTDSMVILRELGNAKYISYLDGNKRKEKNKKFEGIKFTKTNDKKTLLGYECNRVIANLTDGSTYDVYYTNSVVPSTTEYEYQFKDLPGLVLEYDGEFEHGKTKVKFTASKITLVPVPAATFDIPKTGYRVL